MLTAEHDVGAGELDTDGDHVADAGSFAFGHGGDLFHAQVAVHDGETLGTDEELNLQGSLSAGLDLESLQEEILQDVQFEILGIQSAEELDESILNT